MTDTRELRIYGPPGTGKTTYLKQRVEATVKARGAETIRIASLTRAAAAEIASRVTLPDDSVGTLHAHAFRALDRPELAETPQGIEAWNHVAHKLGEAFVMSKPGRPLDLDDAGGEGMAPASEGEGLLQSYSMFRARAWDRRHWPKDVLAFAEHWERFKRETDRLDFNDLIERAAAEVTMMPGGPSVLLLDEAQDMSKLDMMLARQWGAHCDVFVMVGDPDQNLYQWRGSEPEAWYGGLTEDEVPDHDVHVLERSYRVPAAVHGYAVRWLENTLPSRSRVNYYPRLGADDQPVPGTVRRSPHSYREPEALAAELEEHLASNRRVMILAACGFHLDPLMAVLRRNGVPFGNPYREKDGKLNPLAGAQRLRGFLDGHPVYGGTHWTWNDVRLWAEPLKAQGVFHRGGKAFIDAKCAGGGRFSETKPGDQPADWEAVMGLLTDEARMHLGLGDLDYYAQQLRSTRSSGLAYALNVVRKHGPRALHNAPKTEGGEGLILGTIHSVKGGEAEVVYVFPDLSRAGFEGWCTRGPRHDAVARQMYVAFTRAREELVLCERGGGFSVGWPIIDTAVDGGE